MTYNITSDLKGIDLFAEGPEEILQNVIMIVTVVQESVPLFREFGSTFRAVDKPLVAAEAIFRAETLEQIYKYEPRAKVKSIDFVEEPLDGKLKTRLEVNI